MNGRLFSLPSSWSSAAAGSDVDQSRILGFANFFPCDHAMSFGGCLAASGRTVRKHAAGGLVLGGRSSNGPV